MKRRVNRQETEALVTKLRERIPNLVMRTTLIVGFPGETDEECALREVLETRLARENRAREAQACFRFLPSRARLDLMGWGDQDIFSHS